MVILNGIVLCGGGRSELMECHWSPKSPAKEATRNGSGGDGAGG